MNDKEVLVEKREIRFSGEIDTEKTNYLINEMKKLEREEERDPIDLYVNSRGGKWDEFIAIYDTMKQLKCEVNTIATGRAMSAGAMIVMSGTGQRKAYKHARFLLHSLSVSSPRRSIKDNKVLHEEQERIEGVLEEIVSKETGVNQNVVREDLERDVFMLAEEAMDYGLIDELIEGGT